MKKVYISPFTPNGRHELIAHCKTQIHAGKSFVYLTPSRESMFEVRSLFMETAGALFHGHVYGFNDLVRSIIGDILNHFEVLNKHQIQVLVQSIIQDLPDKAPYEKVLDKPGFVKGVYKFISDLKWGDYSFSSKPDSPSTISDSTPPSHDSEPYLTLSSVTTQTTPFSHQELSLSHNNHHVISMEKFTFVRHVFEEYQTRLKKEHWLDPEEMTLLARDHVAHSPFLEKTPLIILDGFQRLEPSRIRVLQSIINEWPDTDILFHVPYLNQHKPGLIQSSILNDLSKLGFEQEIIDSGLKDSAPTPSLRQLVSSLYGPKSELEVHPAQLTLVAHPCRDHEIRETAKTIVQLIAEQHISPDRLAIYCADKASYQQQLIEICKEWNIPLSASLPQPLHQVPIIRDITALLTLRLDDQLALSMTNLVSSKYLIPLPVLQKLEFEPHSLLEAAMQCKAINDPVLWNQRFNEAIDAINLPHQETQNWLDMLDAFHPENTGSILSAIHSLQKMLNRLNPEVQLEAMAKRGILSTEMLLRYMKALSTFRALLNRLLLAHENTTSQSHPQNPNWYRILVKEIQDLLDQTDTGLVRLDHSGVKYQTPEMASGQMYHTIFMLGFNENSFPKSITKSILFTDQEQNELRSLGVPLVNPDAERILSQIVFQSMLATAEESIHLSWCTASEDGSLLNVSPFIENLAEQISPCSLAEIRPAPVSMRQRVVSIPLSGSEHAKVAEHMENERFNGATRGRYDGLLSNPVLSQQDSNFGFSPSQLNAYARCPFVYFSERVLGLSEQDDEPLNAMDIGSFYHAVLKDYYGEPNLNSSLIKEFSPNRLKSVFDKNISALDFSHSNPLVALHQKAALLNTLDRFLLFDQSNLNRYHETTGNYLVPIFLEEPFDLTMVKGIRLRGIVDRVDLEMDLNQQYTGRYIMYDYKKKGVKELKDVVMGKDFQLPLYRAALESRILERFHLRKAECLALLYYSIENQEWKGIIRSDMKQVLFDARKRPMLVSSSTMDLLLKWVEAEARENIQSIQAGDYRVPYSCPSTGMMQNCPYLPVCRFDAVRMAKKTKAEFEPANIARSHDGKEDA